MSKAVHLFLIALAILAIPSVSSAYLGLVSTQPANPSVDSVVTITVSGGFSDGCWQAMSNTVTVEGTNILIVVEANDSWDGVDIGCTESIVEYEFSHEVGPLPGGQYTVTFVEARNSLRDPGSDLTKLAFTVTPDPGQCLGTVGNINCDDQDVTDIADITALIDHLFITFDPLGCEGEANVDADPLNAVDIADLTALIDHLFINFPPLPECSPYRTYDYTAYDQSMAPVVAGTMIVGENGAAVFGFYNLSLVQEGATVGPQVGAGIVRGTIQGDSVVVGLNSGLIDANVYLYGVRNPDSFSGTWKYIGYPGLVAEGPFTLVRR